MMNCEVRRISMCEILFRGKRADSGEWVKGYLICPEFDKSRAYIGYLFPDDDHDLDVAEVASSTVGRFTGLTDKNGVKVFEGDIVLHKGEYGLVGYSYDYGMFEVDFDYCFASFIDISASNCEVLGNIYDNPELMEVSGND